MLSAQVHVRFLFVTNTGRSETRVGFCLPLQHQKK